LQHQKLANLLTMPKKTAALSSLISDHMQFSDIANVWGFWHMGDFAQRYRRLFGELPAEQLIKSY